MRRILSILVVAALLIILLAASAAVASARVWPSTPRSVATFSPGDYGSFAEGMAADSHGDLWVSLTTWGLYDDSVDPAVTTSDIGEIWKVTPAGHATLKATMDLTPTDSSWASRCATTASTCRCTTGAQERSRRACTVWTPAAS